MRLLGDERMKRGFIGLVAVIALCAASVRAEPFKCPHVGGTFVFGQEANINTLDQMTSSTISTRNIAMNIYESLMTRIGLEIEPLSRRRENLGLRGGVTRSADSLCACRCRDDQHREYGGQGGPHQKYRRQPVS